MVKSTAIYGATTITMDPDRRILDNALIVIEDGRIVEITTEANGVPSADRVIDGRGKVVLPGLVNCHIHTRPARAMGDGLPMEEWHRLYPENVTRYMSLEDSRIGSLIAFSESVQCGTTSLMDMTYKPLGAGQAAKEIGLRATIVPLASDHPEMRETCDSFDDNIELIEKHADLDPELVRFWIGCDSILETSTEMLKNMAKAARQYDVGIHTHMSETKSETEYIPKHFDGKHAAKYLEEQGILGPNTVLAHCNWLTDAEIELLRKTDTRVAHCPTSNMRFGSGICPVPKLLDAGITVGLGTDGMLSSYKMDMFEVMRGALNIQRITKLDPYALRSEQALEMATLGGARALGLEQEIGSLEVGKKGDLILIDFQDVKFSPLIRGEHDNLLALLVWTASGDDVDTVLIDGQVIVVGGKLQTVDTDKISRQGHLRAKAIMERVGPV